MTDPTIPPRPETMSDAESSAPSDRKTNRRALFIGVPVVALLLGVGWLFSAKAQAPAAPTNLADLPRVDGTLSVAESDRLVMTLFEPVDGQSEMEFVVPEKYAGNFDLAHMRSHSSVGIPTRIYYLDEQQDGSWVAVYKADAPVNSSDR